MRPEEIPALEVVRVSYFNRTVVCIVLVLVAWEACEVYKIRTQTSQWQSQIAENKAAIEANTKTLVESIKGWTTAQQEMSNWMKANQQVVEKIRRDNPHLKIPKPPPIPAALPKPDKVILDSTLDRPALAPTPPTSSRSRHRKRPTPTPTPSFWDKMWHKKPDQMRSQMR